MKSYIEFYQDQRDKVGTPQGLLYTHDEDYWLVVKNAGKLLKEQVTDLQSRYGETRVSVLDVGCGYGNLADELPGDIDYLGIDGCDWIYQEAKKQHPALKFKHGEVTSVEGRYDFVVAVGVLATMPYDEVRGFIAELKKRARWCVLVSFQLPELYKGKLAAYTLGKVNYEFKHGRQTFELLEAVMAGTEFVGLWIYDIGDSDHD